MDSFYEICQPQSCSERGELTLLSAGLVGGAIVLVVLQCHFQRTQNCDVQLSGIDSPAGAGMVIS